MAAWLAVHTSKTAVVELLRVAWATVGAIVNRVVAEDRAARDPFDGLVRIGLDEISYKRGHRYLMIAVDHHTGRLIWAAPGHDRKTLDKFFDLLGEQRCARIRAVSCDALGWIGDTVKHHCPGAVVCIDPFHVAMWATDALDEVRRETWNDARADGMKAYAKELKGARFALWRNPEDLTSRQEAKAGVDREGEPAPLPGLPVEGAAAPHPAREGPAGDRDAPEVDRLGVPKPDPTVR